MAKRKLDQVLDRPSDAPKVRQSGLKAVPKDSPALKKSKTEPAEDKPRSEPRDVANAHSTSNVSSATGRMLQSIQIITGSYERVLHGFVATLPVDHSHVSSEPKDDPSANANGDPKCDEGASQPSVAFSDTFLFSAHSSSIRSLAISQSSENHKRVLATGGSDERINLYNISATPPGTKSRHNVPALSKTAIVENPRNRELGTLLHHSRAVTKLHFPTKGKLFSAAEDNTVAISRTRDWTVLSTIKVPIPKPAGRPSGDTAAPGEVPAGVNDFAIHPSMKLMVTVGRGEKSMRLWNLVTGKKAGVLSFDRDLLAQVGEGRYGSGEGRRVLWTESGEDFVVGFERGAVVFGMDCKPKAVIRTTPPTKIHQMRFLPAGSYGEHDDVLALSTEDGRIIFYAIDNHQAIESTAKVESHPSCIPLAQFGGALAGLPGRIKDFEILLLPPSDEAAQSTLLFVTASSDGAVRLWSLDPQVLSSNSSADVDGDDGAAESKANGEQAVAKQVGDLVATHETGNRVTCLAAFLMDQPAEDHGTEDGEGEFGGFSDESGNSGSSDSSDGE